jgi:enoyl-CoA hydratase
MKDTRDFTVGQKSSIEKVFTEEEVRLFSTISRDTNPIHLDPQYAAGTRFKQRIVQGPFVESLIGGILGSSLPGEGTIYLKQATNFLKPVYIGDKITANVEVVSVRRDKPIITLRTWVEKQNGELVIDGEAVVMLLKEL